jgi:phosphoenolpyruvate-protein kinase (PTS system EI component)
VAEAVALCRPEVICAYPISPQTHIVESLSQLVKTGELAPCEFVNVESEFAAMSVAIGACATGARAYTATARARAVAVAAEEGLAYGDDFRVGTMIELPRACLIADRIARHADFFSFGTNDLTQTAIGFSRDDIEGRIIPRYVEEKIVNGSPFASLDKAGVGELVRIAVRLGRRGRADIELGICGEHGGDPDSIRFFHLAGLDYVSCSPFRLPIARVAAAQAAIIAPRAAHIGSG